MVTDGIINGEVITNLAKIRTYPIRIDSEEALIKEIARIANLSTKLGYQLEAQKRILAKDEAYRQIGHSASLLKAILAYIAKLKPQVDYHNSLYENFKPEDPCARSTCTEKAPGRQKTVGRRE